MYSEITLAESIYASRVSGFTLIEMMVAIVVLIIVVAIGGPGLAQLKRNNEATATTNDLLAALNYARSEAVRQGSSITVNPRDVDGDGTADWAEGWSVNDTGGNQIRVFQAAASTSTIALEQLATGTARANVVFQRLGDVTEARCFEVTIDGLVRSIQVSATGRGSIQQGVCP